MPSMLSFFVKSGLNTECLLVIMLHKSFSAYGEMYVGAMKMTAMILSTWVIVLRIIV